ncbi:MAG: trigger factor [Elusimicrobia bacterium]|nr:trigger factor [Elusimicrobiota bacterium]
MATGMILDKIKAKKGKEQGCVTTVEVEVPLGMVQDAMHNVWLRIQGQARIPGFRPGKAPLALVQQQFGGEAKERAIHQLIQKTVPDAIAQLGLKPVATPEVRDLQFEAGKPLRFQFDVESAPKFELKAYKKLKAARKKYPASDEEVSKRIEELREGNARLDRAPEEAVGQQHYAVIDFHASQDGKPAKDWKGADELVDMSSPQTVEGLTQGLLGAKRGESRDVPVTFEDGRKAMFHVTIKELKAKVLPALDDEFAKDVGFQTLDELKAKMRDLIEQEGKVKSEREVTAQLEDALLKAHAFEPPPTLVNGQLERLAERVQEQIIGPNRQLPDEEYKKLVEKLTPRAEAEVRLSFLLRAIAAAEKIEATPKEVEEELARTLEDAPSEERRRGIRKFFEERQDEIRGMLRDRKTMVFVRENAAISDS